jgi:hypothetical protein
MSWWKSRRWLAVLLAPIAAGLTACAPLAPIGVITPTPPLTASAAPPAALPPTPASPTLPVTLLLQAAPLGDTPAQPVYTIVTDPKEWDNLNGQIPEAALQAGRKADVPIIVAFAGVKGSSGYQVDVPRAQLEADRLIITVEVAAPGADDITEPATTLPFAIATIPSDTLSAARAYTIIDDRGVELSRGQFTTP